MNKSKLGIIIGFIAIFILGIAIGMLLDDIIERIGNKNVIDHTTTNSDGTVTTTYSDIPLDFTTPTTFYATIEKIWEYDGITAMQIKGLEINDINHRGTYEFSIKETTELLWHNVKMDKTELEVGDNVSITYTGFVNESYPARLTNVTKIILLDDEK